jgi:hypothetical protein
MIDRFFLIVLGFKKSRGLAMALRRAGRVGCGLLPEKIVKQMMVAILLLALCDDEEI